MRCFYHPSAEAVGVCVGCGKAICRECLVEREGRSYCRECAVKAKASAAEPRDWLVALLFSIFLGFLGVDRFYLGRTGTAVVKLLTIGGFGIWYLIDVILIASNSLTDARDQPLTRADEVGIAWMPTVAGILNIVAGVTRFVLSVAILAVGPTYRIESFWFGMPHVSWLMASMSVVVAALLLVLGVLSIMGGVYALQRRAWGLSLTGSISSVLYSPLLGIPAIIFVVLARREFDIKESLKS